MRRRELLEDEEAPRELERMLEGLTGEEARFLDTIVEELSRPEAHDPKTAAVKYFLTEHRSEGKTWLEHGCIVFSQYYDTVRALAADLAAALPGEPIAIYAGAGKSGIHRDGDFATVGREEIKARCASTKSASSLPPTPHAKA
jgi:ERCC4-related helicase